MSGSPTSASNCSTRRTGMPLPLALPAPRRHVLGELLPLDRLDNARAVARGGGPGLRNELEALLDSVGRCSHTRAGPRRPQG
jgi:hypothetical protein